MIIPVYLSIALLLVRQGYSAPFDIGVSERFVVSLGTGTKPYLSARLNSKNNAQFHAAIIARLGMDNEYSPDPQIFSVLRTYVDSRLDEPVDNYANALESALRNIGLKGGVAGVRYLKQWVIGDTQVSRIKSLSKKEYTRISERLIINAIFGLGYSGQPEALSILETLKQSPPSLPTQKRGLQIIDAAIADNLQIQKRGAKEYLKYDLELLERLRNP